MGNYANFLSSLQVFVVDNRNRDEIIKTILLVLLIIVFPVWIHSIIWSIRTILDLTRHSLVDMSSIEGNELNEHTYPQPLLPSSVSLSIPLQPAAIAIQANECNIHVCVSLGLMVTSIHSNHVKETTEKWKEWTIPLCRFFFDLSIAFLVNRYHLLSNLTFMKPLMVVDYSL